MFDMNTKERIDAVVALEQPDRVPVAPMLDHFAATYTDYTNAEIMSDGDKRIDAVLKTAKELGPWDMTFLADPANARLLKLGVPLKLKQPGIELPDNEIHQFDEKELLNPDDYDLLEQVGAIGFIQNIFVRNYPEMNGPDGIREILRSREEYKKQSSMVMQEGIEVAAGFIHPGMLYDYFSFGRGITAMSADTFKLGDKIISASKVWAEGTAQIAIDAALDVNVPRVFIGMARSSPEFISKKNFERLVLPELSYYVKSFTDAGITPLFHCDTNWTKFLEIFKSFPAGKCIMMLDSKTDIFKAKEILKGHMCIMGDVPAELLAKGSRDDVLSYCKRLIDIVGKDGGFILSSGCSIPANAKVENVRALMESVEKWGRY